MVSNQNNELPEGFKMTALGTLPEEWDVVQVDEAIKLSRGISWSKSDESTDGVPVVAIPNIKEGRVNYDFHYRISKHISDEKTLRAGDILLVGSSGSIHNVGRTALVPDIPFPKLTFASFLVKASPSAVNIDHSFSFYLLRSGLIDYAACSKRAADGKFNLQVDQVRHFSIPLPPLPEQRAIAHVLSTIQRAIEAQDKLIAAARELKKSLMRHLFTYGPVPISEAEQVPLKETEIGLVPEHWEVVRLGEVTEKPEYGFTATASSAKVGPKFLRITDIQNGGVDWVSVPYCQCSPAEEEKYRLHSGDILFARIGATTGKTLLITECPLAIFASYLIRGRTKAFLLPAFLSQFTSTLGYWTQVNSSKGGRLKQGINIPVLTGLLIPLPLVPEQQEIASILSTVGKKIETEQNRKASLQTLFQTMLHLLMTGKVRVKDLEVPVS